MNDEPKYDDSSSTDTSLLAEAIMTLLMGAVIIASAYAFLEAFV